jgi:hypothetical protein
MKGLNQEEFLELKNKKITTQLKNKPKSKQTPQQGCYTDGIAVYGEKCSISHATEACKLKQQ